MNQRVECPHYWEIFLVVVALPHTSKVGNNNNKSVIIGEILKNDKKIFPCFLLYSDCVLRKLQYSFHPQKLKLFSVLTTDWNIHFLPKFWVLMSLSARVPVSPVNPQVSGLRSPSLRPQYCWVLPTWRTLGLTISFRYSSQKLCSVDVVLMIEKSIWKIMKIYT